jgi:predicted transcriptional regulator
LRVLQPPPFTGKEEKMSIEKAYKELYKRVKKDGRKNLKDLAKKIKICYSTLQVLMRGKSPGTVRSWIKVEKYYTRQDNR